MRKVLHIITFFVLTILTACSNSESGKKNCNVLNVTSSNVNKKTINSCDTFSMDKQPMKDYKESLSVWLETTTLEWFLQRRQSVWREAKVWINETCPIDNISIIKCLSNDTEKIFLYIPTHFYKKDKHGNEYFQFFIVNNSKDTIKIPCHDRIIDNISSSVSLTSNNVSVQQWLSFQKTDSFVECGNSIWTMKLAPKTVIISEIESQYIGLGDSTVNYRLEFTFEKRKVISNSIKINLMRKQLPYLGKTFE